MSCPTPDKATYADRAEAQRAAARIRADLRGPCLTPYPCRCGLWHLKSGDNLTARIRASLGRGGGGRC